MLCWNTQKLMDGKTTESTESRRVHREFRKKTSLRSLLFSLCPLWFNYIANTIQGFVTLKEETQYARKNHYF